MKALVEQIEQLDGTGIYGRVVEMVDGAGPITQCRSARVLIETGPGRTIPGEGVFQCQRAADAVRGAGRGGVRRGCLASSPASRRPYAFARTGPGEWWTVWASRSFGKGPLRRGPSPYPSRNAPPPAHARPRVGGALDLGARALISFVTYCRGRRMGMFSAPASASRCCCR